MALAGVAVTPFHEILEPRRFRIKITLLSLHGNIWWPQEVTKRFRLSWLTNIALIYEPKCEWRGGGGCGVSANEYSCAHGAWAMHMGIEHNGQSLLADTLLRRPNSNSYYGHPHTARR